MTTRANMRQGTCPQCGSQEVYVLERTNRQFMVKLGFSGVTEIPAEVLTCLDCGYVEQYLQLTDKHKKKIRNEAPRAGS